MADPTGASDPELAQRALSRLRIELEGARAEVGEDTVAVEAPLEIRIDGVPIAVVMRTPGRDADLVWGFLRTEAIVTRPEEVRSVRHCDTVDRPEAEDNVMQVRLAPEASVDVAGLRRNLYTSSSCGVCGKASLERALARSPGFDDWAAMPTAAQMLGWVDALRSQQRIFDATGGLHAAGLVDAEGKLLAVREDVGRHNAVDKVIGARFARGEAMGDASLVVSGRVSFEIVQKALAARVRRIVAVSAPTSLAVELAREAKLGLAAFVREGRATLYAADALCR